jgi:hypothetical protein
MPPAPGQSAMPMTLPTPGGAPAAPTASAWTPRPPAFPTARRPSSTTLRRSAPRRNNLGWALLIFAALAGSTLFSVHVYVMPLPVAAVYFRPAFIDVLSEPAGADVWVDGLKVLGSTPATVEVRRDHRQHLVEVRKEGYLPASQELRYDREVHMQMSFRLQREPRPAP